MKGYDTKKEIVGCLTGTFVFRPRDKGLKVLQGDGTIVVRDETLLDEQNLFYHQYYATVYGEIEPTSASLTGIQKGGFYDGGHIYDVFLKRATDEFHLGEAMVGESLGQRAFRFEFSGKVEYQIKNKFGRAGFVSMIGKSLE